MKIKGCLVAGGAIVLVCGVYGIARFQFKAKCERSVAAVYNGTGGGSTFPARPEFLESVRKVERERGPVERWKLVRVLALAGLNVWVGECLVVRRGVERRESIDGLPELNALRVEK